MSSSRAMQRLCGLMRKAVQDYEMIAPGDKVMVGVSGGKDSVALTIGLAELRKYIGFDFTVQAVTLDPQFGGRPMDYTVLQELFARFPGIRELAAASPEEIEAIVKPCGLGHSKARDISACMRMLRDKYDCNVPDDFDALLELPGVGRKSANLIMGDVFGKPAIVTDTHCIRLCNRIGLVDNIKEPKKVEMALWKIIPPQEGSDFCHRLVDHGRAVCTARTTPYCERCCLRDVCRYAHEEGKAD